MSYLPPSVPRSQFGNYAKIVLKVFQIYQNYARFQIEALLFEREVRPLYNSKTSETWTQTRNMTLTLGYLNLTTMADYLDDSGTNG